MDTKVIKYLNKFFCKDIATEILNFIGNPQLEKKRKLLAVLKYMQTHAYCIDYLRRFQFGLRPDRKLVRRFVHEYNCVSHFVFNFTNYRCTRYNCECLFKQRQVPTVPLCSI